MVGIEVPPGFLGLMAIGNEGDDEVDQETGGSSVAGVLDLPHVLEQAIDRWGRLFLTYKVTVLGFALAMLVAAVQVKANQLVSLATQRDGCSLDGLRQQRGRYPRGRRFPEGQAGRASISWPCGGAGDRAQETNALR